MHYRSKEHHRPRAPLGRADTAPSRKSKTCNSRRVAVSASLRSLGGRRRSRRHPLASARLPDALNVGRSKLIEARFPSLRQGARHNDPRHVEGRGRFQSHSPTRPRSSRLDISGDVAAPLGSIHEPSRFPSAPPERSSKPDAEGHHQNRGNDQK
jgi:hypothetical protein